MAAAEMKAIDCPSDMDAYVGVTSRSGVKRLAAIISKFDNVKRNLVMETGFGGLLHLPQINMNQRKFTVWLLAHIDPERRSIVINDQEILHIRDSDVKIFLGIPCGPRKLCGIDASNVEEKVDFIRHAIGSISNDPEELNSLKAAEQVITKEYPEGMEGAIGERFKTSFVCFAIGDFLVAKSKANHGIADYWGSLLKVDDIPSYNFCTMVIDEIMETARKVQYLIKAKKPIPILSGCNLFLQGYYLTMRTFGKIELPANKKPLIAGLDCENIRKMMMADQAARKMVAEVGTTSLSGKSDNSSSHVQMEYKTAPIKMNKADCEPFRTSVTSYLDLYIRGEVDQKLTIPQVMDLKWHNARMIYHVNSMKKSIGNLTAVDTRPEVEGIISSTNAVLDRQLQFILQDNVNLAKRLHDHAVILPVIPSASKHDTNSLKRDSFGKNYEDSSSECSSINKKTCIRSVCPDIIKDTISPVDDNLGFQTLQSKGHSQSALNDLQNATASSFQTPAILKPNWVVSPGQSSSTKNTLQNVEESSYHTPAILKPNVVVSPASSARQMSEAGLLYRILEAEDGFNLNARSLENEFSDSPVEKIPLRQGPMAKNPWENGTKKIKTCSDVAQKIMVRLVYNESDELARIWIMHTQPRYIEITGHALKNMLVKGLPVSYEFFDISARRLSQLDYWMYGPVTKQCFRHIFESDFAMFVLANEDPLSYRSVREQLVSASEYYDISECRLLSVPALVRKTWCGYVWDMELHCVHIIDPTFDRARAVELNKLHDYNVNKIEKALSKCISVLFSGWNVQLTAWPTNYVKPIISGASDHESGILTLLALRDFNGTGFVTDHNEESVQNFKAFMLHEDLCIEGNNANMPSAFVNLTGGK